MSLKNYMIDKLKVSESYAIVRPLVNVSESYAIVIPLELNVSESHAIVIPLQS